MACSLLPKSSSTLTMRSNEHKNQKGRPTCDHCNNVGHTKDTCWDLYGKPPDWNPQKD